MATRGRVLLAHQQAYEEWGVSGLVQLAPSPTGEGLAFRLAPAWGVTASGVDRVWATNTAAGLGPPAAMAQPGGRVELVVGYGLWVSAIGGKVAPFTGMEFTDQGLSRLRVGLVWDRLGTRAGDLGVELTGEHLETAPGQPEQRIGVQIQFRFGGSGGAAFVPPVRTPRAHSSVSAPLAVKHRDVVKPRAAKHYQTRALPHGPARRDGAPQPRGAAKPRGTAKHHAVGKGDPYGERQHTSADGVLKHTGGYRHFVQLGAFKRPVNAIKARTELAVHLSGILRHLNRRLAVVGSKHSGLTRVVVAHAFRSRRTAAALCAAIKARGPDCSVTRARPVSRYDPLVRPVPLRQIARLPLLPRGPR